MTTIYEDLAFTGLNEFEINNALWRNDMVKRIQIKEKAGQESMESDAVGRLNWDKAFNSDKLKPKLNMFGRMSIDKRAIAHYSK